MIQHFFYSEIPGRHIQKGLGEYMCEHCSFIAKRSDVFLRHQLVEHPQEDQGKL